MCVYVCVNMCVYMCLGVGVCVCDCVCVCVCVCTYKFCARRYVQVSSYRIFRRDTILSSGMIDTLGTKSNQA
jgi:hypothetical protein